MDLTPSQRSTCTQDNLHPSSEDLDLEAIAKVANILAGLRGLPLDTVTAMLVTDTASLESHTLMGDTDVENLETTPWGSEQDEVASTCTAPGSARTSPGRESSKTLEPEGKSLADSS